MSGRVIIAVLTAWALTLPSPGRTEALRYPVSIQDGPLSSGLRALEIQTSVELLYDGDVVRNYRSPPVAGRLSTEAALDQMLSETDLTVRRTASGAWIIERPATAPLAQQDAAVAEILVVGRRTQNADIRRFEDDVQPYRVAMQSEIVRAHRDNIDQFISSRITSNTTIIPSIASLDAGVMSSFDLRGLGEADTVVLVDGRRMPSLPENYSGFRQTDVNAIPLHAIERIEILTGAAGGIHGFGALGGVVNVVLDRDAEGFDLFTTQGISSRGDARRHGLEARFGRTFNDGTTDLVLFASHQQSDTVHAAARDFSARDLRRTLEIAPDYFPLRFSHGDSITVRSLSGSNLTFKPEYGGGQLNSTFTYLPTGFSGNAATLVASLGEHAGDYDFSLADNDAGRDLGPNPRSTALLANLRHRFESGWETYADVVLLRNRGESFGPMFAGTSGGAIPASSWGGGALIAPESPANPFNEYISVDYPILTEEGRVTRRFDNSRYTAGIEASLPFDWRGTVESSWGRLRATSFVADESASTGSFLLLLGDPSDLETNPLGDWNAFNRALGNASDIGTDKQELQTRFRTHSLRLAGPVFDTRVGPATLTLLAERRSEYIPANTEIVYSERAPTSTTREVRIKSRSEVTQSLYGELRAQPVRGLELQLAMRHDDREHEFSGDPRSTNPERFDARFTGTAYTLGAKFSPTRWLMLRGSYATGEQPPEFTRLIELGSVSFFGSSTPDPKRGGAVLNDGGTITVRVGGNPGLEAARAKTASVGLVLTPTGEDGPRIGLDYSHIRRTGDPRQVGTEEVLANEDEWPDRVTRAPLSSDDLANGYTGGLVQMIDARDINSGGLKVDSFDLRAEWPLTFLDGQLRLYADATYHKRNLRTTQFEPGLERAGYLDGPLKRRANAGFDWSRNELTMGANLQYLGSSLIFSRDAPSADDETEVRIQGSARIPSQTYLDLYGTWRLPFRGPGSVDRVTLDVGVINVLDKAPPRLTWFVSPGPGYSPYGDSRMRRFELGVSCHF